MTSARSIQGARMNITMGDRAFVVRVTQRDYIHWDKVAPRHKWGSSQDVPFLFSTFLSWSAARRGDQFTGTFDEWCDVVDDVTPLKGEDEEVSDSADPTRLAATDESSSS